MKFGETRTFNEDGMGKLTQLLTRWCLLRRTQRILPTRTCRGGIFWSRSPRYSYRYRHHHSRNPHTGSSRRARSPHSRTNIFDSKALQVPRQLRHIVRCQGPESWSFGSCPVRVTTIQASQWSGCSQSLLWCSPFHHGEWCQGLRSCC
jgi:hypothetical protein